LLSVVTIFIFILPIHGRGRSSILWCRLQFLSTRFYSLHYRGLPLSLVRFISRCLTVVEATVRGIVFPSSFLVYVLLVYRNVADFCMWIRAMLPKEFIRSRAFFFFWWDLWGSFKYRIYHL
jgi:hypothetical protein